MKRIDRIYEYIIQQTEKFTLEELKNNSGFSAMEISKKLNILRNNVSMELNQLLRNDKIIKIKSRPVLYLDKRCVERILDKKLENKSIEINSIDDILLQGNAINSESSPFDKLIGAKTSLKNQIEQAKAAILYPPNGLNTLIVGQTGVGKTLFANMMYNQAKHVEKIGKDSPFIVFNCADYYNNPQLLISHLFGHVKGAYTGADADKAGIIEKANGGILFLDEIHRLPPEGQEMLFYFMDTGNFNRLGETERNRKSCILIIGATTEDPNSSLLKTFIRRIPIIITIPSFEERASKDKVDLIKFLFSNEAHRVNKAIKIEEEVVKALIGSTTYGNVGQLKSNIQLICAKGFLNSMANKEYIEIQFKSLPSDIKNGLFYLTGKRKEMEEISNYLESQLVVTPDGYNELSHIDSYDLPFNLYKIIEDKAAILKEGGADKEYINNFITTDINIHIKSFYNKVKNNENDRNKILKIVDEDILKFSEEVIHMVEKEINKKLSDRFLYALSLHLSSFLNRLKNKRALKYTNMDGIIDDKREQFNIALNIKGMVEKKFNVIVPEIEVVYLTLLLNSIQEEKSNGHVGIIVAAHGSSTASSMVDVAKQLLGNSSIEALDMPLDVNPTEILERIIEKARELDTGKGVLLLVDMGSLANFDTVISERTGIKVKTIDMVSTPIVLEAIRKVNILDMDIDSVYHSIKDFKGYGRSELIRSEDNNLKAIVTICSTGEGTAEKLRELIENIIMNITSDEIEVIPVGVRNLQENIKSIEKKYKIIASVGIIDPKIQVPFISIESLIGGNGEELLSNIIKNKFTFIEEKQHNIVSKKICEDSLNQFLTYLNPSKIISVLFDFISVLEKNLNIKFNNSMSIRLMVHVGCALERAIIRDPLVYKYDKSILDKKVIESINRASNIFKSTINVKLSEDEIYYISEMIK
ncbi:transcriptional regulatory protein LevR [Clostridium pasteurianum DSM 525 = ATCC 6013]|uniref:PTS system transcriptional activator n=1 Tax=Clostridium pasteurianum DSM 525 = ATCC 6013 TaxID=1262449 RepID=A0A0H3JAM8_CLOPA|nr:sigma-54-dependent transcriptional regulator [Clostridium pasteurianum]AJA49683.1 transcriptional regulatory protein LevR [Clostridium pasteurianum DSM 525 = ATCC 6013]AJA53671.1 transcriptional regulatory protein LevR [Clostridium pasteurianum DSM 525 = ATCC 6013]AOZ76834.1 PTS sugar transporter subunit IIA [Clostridium pasteurianum DSM 525 = ATCC 6013]AOZ80631.1 PTS sugar transporter subunit IIA [Clostridium pasteurianum]ELP57627.1 sigma-54 factor, interaction domain-containing protein [C